MEREYIKISKPSSPFHTDTNVLKTLDSAFWKKWIFYHILLFYKNFDKVQINKIIATEKLNAHSRVEDAIAKYIRDYLKNSREFSMQGFLAKGGILNDENTKGIYDISILHSFWKNNDTEVNFNFECKNLDSTQDLVNKYVYYNQGNSKFDGGVYRYFNGKYSVDHNFGGMIGFVLEDNITSLKSKIFLKLRDKFDTTPDGDLLNILDNSIENNVFSFDSVHTRSNEEFILHHLLFDFS